jgi:IS5 family transposase
MQLPNKRRPKSRRAGEYKIKNWKEYNQALKQRGSLEIWIENDIESKWYYQGKPQRGAQFKYSAVCIEMAAMLRAVYHLPYRQLEGFIKSLVIYAKWDVIVPEYTVIHKRIKKLNISVPQSLKKSAEKKYIVIDSTGLKVYGEGEWKVRKHGWNKHRRWMKLHMVVDEATAIIENCCLTGNNTDDASVVEPLLDGVKGRIKKIAGDGAYDQLKVYKALKKRKIKAIIPPRKVARIKKHGNKRGKPLARDKNIRGVRKWGRKLWKIKTNYHRRSLAETAIYRYKIIFGGQLKAREVKMQSEEIKIKCKVLNRMTQLGMPESYEVKKAA